MNQSSNEEHFNPVLRLYDCSGTVVCTRPTRYCRLGQGFLLALAYQLVFCYPSTVFSPQSSLNSSPIFNGDYGALLYVLINRLSPCGLLVPVVGEHGTVDYHKSTFHGRAFLVALSGNAFSVPSDINLGLL
jgi:hypothetical protein